VELTYGFNSLISSYNSKIYNTTLQLFVNMLFRKYKQLQNNLQLFVFWYIDKRLRRPESNITGFFFSSLSKCFYGRTFREILIFNPFDWILFLHPAKHQLSFLQALV